jgi:adenylylsulfate kinase
MPCILITGTPKSGKTTLAYRLHKKYIKGSVILDGDELRAAIKYTDFSKEGRDKWLEIVGDLAKTFEHQGLLPLVALVSPYKEARQKLLSKFKKAKLVWIRYEKKNLWEGSTYEDPDDEEAPIIINRKDGVYYKIPQELRKWIIEVVKND